MTLTSLDVVAATAETNAPPTLDLVVPVYNEAGDLAASIRRLQVFLATSFPFSCRITIADNASTDDTRDIAEQLEAELTGVRMLYLPAKGRGRALRAAWTGNDAAVVAYMDVDLSTDLAALLPLVAPLVSGHSDLAIGTRLSPAARVVRGSKRELISRSYNALLRASLGAGFSDAQCGFKAIRTDCAQTLLPLIRDDGWFFDTELLVLAERAGLRIHEVPVDWVDDLDSRVDLVHTAMTDLRGVLRMFRDLNTGRIDLSGVRALRAGAHQTNPGLAAQMLRFAGVGVLSTIAYLLLYLAMRGTVGAQAANAIALLVTAIGNTAANRRWTFATHGTRKVLRQHGQGLAVFGVALGITAVSLSTLHAADPHASRGAEAAVLVVANLAATALRFLALRSWVFRPEVSA
jgi:putative flippase GtrA